MIRTAGTFLILLLHGGIAAAEEPELRPDPEVAAILDRLGANECAALPLFKTAGDLNDEARRHGLDKNGPGMRDYCLKMAWMADRKRAIYYGANHGTPHRLNDVWEYDLPSNTWNCLYGPDPSKGRGADYADVDWDDVEDGVIRTRRGGPAIVPHSWWNMTYDPEMKAMLTVCSWSMSHPKLFQYLKNGKHQPPLWAFYPEKRRWEPILESSFDGPKPAYENARAMEYVPELEGTVWTKSAGMWLYSSRENSWKRISPASEYGAGFPAREQVMVHAPDRKLLIAHDRRGEGAPSRGYEGAQTSHYDIEKNAWTVAFESRTKDVPPPGFDARTNFVYDPVGRVCLLWDPFWTGSLWKYDPDST
ncbi:MAG: kelch repeat-containing protein, partial [Planctomycetales bacterium]